MKVAFMKKKLNIGKVVLVILLILACFVFFIKDVKAAKVGTIASGTGKIDDKYIAKYLIDTSRVKRVSTQLKRLVDDDNVVISEGMSVSSNIVSKGIADKTGPDATGTNTFANLTSGATYKVTYDKALKVGSTRYDLIITIVPTISDSSGFVKMRINENNVIRLYTLHAQAKITYTIEDDSHNGLNRYILYGFKDPDVANYKFTPTALTDVYFIEPGTTNPNGNTQFRSDYHLTSAGLISKNNNINDYDDGWFFISNEEYDATNNKFYNTFTVTIDATNPGFSTNGELLDIPNLFLLNGGITIRYHLNGGTKVNGTHEETGTGQVTSSVGDFITLNGSRSIFRFSGGSDTDIESFSKVHIRPSSFFSITTGLANYNNSDYIQTQRLGYNVPNGEEFISKQNQERNFGSAQQGTTYSHGNNQDINGGNGYGISDFTKGTDGVVNLYINWKIITYNITANTNGGTVSPAAPSTYDIESNNISISNPTKTGYTFTGWNKTVKNLAWKGGFINTSGAEVLSSTYPDSYFSGYVSLKGGVTYTLSGYGTYSSDEIRWRVFNTDGTYRGSKTGATYTPASDCNARILFYNTNTATQRNGVTITSSGEKNVSVLKGSTGNITLAAQWQINTSKLTVNPNGGSVKVTSPTGGTQETITASKTYTQNYNTTLSLTTPTKASTTNTITYTISYNGNSGTVGTTNASNTTSSRTDTTTYSFSGWTKSSTFYGTLATNNQTYTFPENNNVTSTITAGYTPSTTSGTQGVITLPNATRTGYEFKGWYTAATGGTKRGDAGGTYTPNNSETLYAQWSVYQVKIRILPNRGTLSRYHGSGYSTVVENDVTYITRNGDKNIHTIDYGTGLNSNGLANYNNPDALNLERLGYKVVSPYIYINNSNNQIYDQTTAYLASDFADCSTGDKVVNLTVNWEPIVYGVEYDISGSNDDLPNPTQYTIDSPVTDIISPTKEGYKFIGWSRTVDHLAWKTGYLNETTGVEEMDSIYEDSYYSGYVSVSKGTTYTISGYGSYDPDDIIWRVYYVSGGELYYYGTSSGSTYTPTNEDHKTYKVRILLPEASTDEQRDNIIVSGGVENITKINNGCTGNIYLVANWEANIATVKVKKDDVSWNNNGINVALYQNNAPVYQYNTATTNNEDVTWSVVTEGTYNIYASKDASNLTTLVDTGITLTIGHIETATIDYYTLMLQNGIGISAVSGGGTYLKNQTANIDATVANGYTWEGWSVISGDTPD